MPNVKLIRRTADLVRQRLATRGAGDEARIDEVLKADELRRKLLGEVEAPKRIGFLRKRMCFYQDLIWNRQIPTRFREKLSSKRHSQMAEKQFVDWGMD